MSPSSGASSGRTQRLGELIIHEAFLTPLLDELRRVVESVFASEMAKLRQSLEAREADRHANQPEPPTPAATTGVELKPADKVQAADLRTALLLGKLPEDVGLLIDTKTTASLLNISPRMLYRLDQVQAVPEPVRLGRLVRWRLGEIIEWVDSDCPRRRSWTYSGQHGLAKKKSR